MSEPIFMKLGMYIMPLEALILTELLLKLYDLFTSFRIYTNVFSSRHSKCSNCREIEVDECFFPELDNVLLGPTKHELFLDWINNYGLVKYEPTPWRSFILLNDTFRNIV
jgi:hypothetical protein